MLKVTLKQWVIFVAIFASVCLGLPSDTPDHMGTYLSNMCDTFDDEDDFHKVFICLFAYNKYYFIHCFLSFNFIV
jgi:hypothetical protein